MDSVKQKLAAGKRGDKPEYRVAWDTCCADHASCATMHHCGRYPIYPDMAPGGQLGVEYKQRRAAVGEDMNRLALRSSRALQGARRLRGTLRAALRLPAYFRSRRRISLAECNGAIFHSWRAPDFAGHAAWKHVHCRLARNWEFFGAPVGLIISIDKVHAAHNHRTSPDYLVTKVDPLIL